jgi:hypothetical protein
MNPFLKMLKSQNPDKEYPSNTGQKWSNEEETLLLEELSENNDIQQIAQSHNRTIGGINARRRQIAYKLYINNTSMEEIILKTKLDKDQILKTINKQKNKPNQCKYVTEIKKPFLIENEIDEIKNDIKKLENIIKELVEMMKAVYEFEDA